MTNAQWIWEPNVTFNLKKNAGNMNSWKYKMKVNKPHQKINYDGLHPIMHKMMTLKLIKDKWLLE